VGEHKGIQLRTMLKQIRKHAKARCVMF